MRGRQLTQILIANRWRAAYIPLRIILILLVSLQFSNPQVESQCLAQLDDRPIAA